MTRRCSCCLALLLVLSACTGRKPEAKPTPTAHPPAETTAPRGPSPVALDVVADATPQASGRSFRNTYLDGMRLAVRVVNEAGGVAGRPLELSVHDDSGDVRTATRALGDLVDRRPTALLYVGPGPVLGPLRDAFARTDTPVVLLQGDLYTSRGLFPQAFQTTIPWRWQANVIARYLARDRKARDVVFLGEGPEAPAALAATREALVYWGARLAAGFTDTSGEPGTVLLGPLQRARLADWVVAFAPPGDVLQLVDAVEGAAGKTFPTLRPGITASSSLLVPAQGLSGPEPGTSACYTYTWAGWARPIPRVGRFEEAFLAALGRAPTGMEQEGYDAVRVLARALETTRGMGGAALIAALERTHDQTYSSFPVDLGPDDHVFLPRDELGLFAVPGPDERLDPWQSRSSSPPSWRPVMRTFTYDGKRDNILDRDRPVFFPFWRKDRPGPYYWRSRYGIVSRSNDALH